MNNILIVEDEMDLRELIDLNLSSNGYNVYQVDNGEDALAFLKSTSVDLVILDIMLPKLDGFQVLKKLRDWSEIPVIFLTAKINDSDKVLGLRLGADDYIEKPFNPIELVARVQANLRRYYNYSSVTIKNEIVAGIFKLDKLRCTLYKDSIPVELNAKEFRIMEKFMDNIGKALTKKQIYESVWQESYLGDDNTIMVHISHIREKIEPDAKNPIYLKTIRGIGYVFEMVSK